MGVRFRIFYTRAYSIFKQISFHLIGQFQRNGFKFSVKYGKFESSKAIKRVNSEGGQFQWQT